MARGYKVKENLKPYANKFFSLLEVITRKYNPNAEILFLAVQKTLALNPLNPNIAQMENLYKIFLQADKKFHAVNFAFKTYIFNMHRAFVDHFYQNNNDNNCLIYINRLEEINLPIDKNAYIMKAEIYRKLGKKDEALKAYEKALDLS